MHLLNNAGLIEKVKSPKGRVASWTKEGKDTPWLVEQVYLATLSRRPTAKELEVVTKHLQSLPNRDAGLHDLQYGLINLNEFLLRH